MGFVIFCCHKELGIYIFKNFNIFQTKSQIHSFYIHLLIFAILKKKVLP